MTRNTSPPSLPRRKLGCLPKLIIGALIIGFLYWLLFAPISETTPSNGGISQPDAIDGELSSQQQAGYETLAAQSSELPRVVAKDGAVRFLSLNVKIPDNVAASPLDKALYFLEQNEGLLQIGDVRKNLRLQEINKDENGNSYINFTQEYQGVPVYRSSITVGVSANAEVNLVNGGYLPNLSISVMPAIRSTDADNTAIVDFDAQNGKTSSPTTLAIYSPSIWGGEDTKAPRIVWIVRITSKANTSSTLLIYVIDALSGGIIDKIDTILNVGGEPYLQIYDAKGEKIPKANLVWYEEGSYTAESNVLSPSVSKTRDHIHQVYDFFWKTFQRDSFDGKGKMVKIYVDVGVLIIGNIDKPCEGAFWHPKDSKDSDDNEE